MSSFVKNNFWYPMKQKDVLFELIKSLTKSEKRYFKLFSSLHSGENKVYLKLFEQIEKMQEQDEKKLMKQWNSNGAKQNYRDIKQYLYHFILKSLDVYYRNDVVDTELQQMLHYIRILNNKELYQQSQRWITKARKLALKHEKHSVLIELISMQINLQHVHAVFHDEKRIEDMVEEYEKEMENLKDVMEYHFVILRMAKQINDKGYIRTDSDREVFQKIIEKKVTQIPSSYWAKRDYYYCQLMYFEVETNFEKMYDVSFAMTKWMEAHPHQISENPVMSVFTLFNLCHTQICLKKYEEASVTVQKLKTFSHTSGWKTKRAKASLFYYINISGLSLCCAIGNFEKATQLIASFQEEMNYYDSMEAYQGIKMLLYYHMAYAYFGQGDYSAANKFINQILNNPASFGTELYFAAKILSLIVYYELGKTYLDISTSVYRSLKGQGRLYSFENKILSFIKNSLLNILNNKEEKKEFVNLKKELIEITKEEPFEKNALEDFDFISWIDSKIEGKPFAEVVRGKLT